MELLEVEVDGFTYAYAVKNGRIVDPGKFVGEPIQTVLDYFVDMYDEKFYFANDLYFRVDNRFYRENPKGLVSLIGGEEFDRAFVKMTRTPEEN